MLTVWSKIICISRFEIKFNRLPIFQIKQLKCILQKNFTLKHIFIDESIFKNRGGMSVCVCVCGSEKPILY